MEDSYKYENCWNPIRIPSSKGTQLRFYHEDWEAQGTATQLHFNFEWSSGTCMVSENLMRTDNCTNYFLRLQFQIRTSCSTLSNANRFFGLFFVPRYYSILLCRVQIYMRDQIDKELRLQCRQCILHISIAAAEIAKVLGEHQIVHTPTALGMTGPGQFNLAKTMLENTTSI